MIDMFKLGGRVAVVTGGNGGIGLGMARGLAQAGAAVMVAGRDRDKNAAAVAELAGLGAEADSVVLEVTEAALRKRYERQVKESPVVEEARARHILVKTEEEAIAVIAELESGAEFAATATAKSIGPSAARGGDLGYFKREQMVPPFAEAAFALKPGEMTKKPVKTQFGWHIILTEDIREIKQPSFEQKRDQLHTDMSREVVRVEMFRLRKSTKIERFNQDGSPIVEPKAEPAEKGVEPKANPTK